MGKPLFTQQQFLEAIPGSGGLITAIARKVGCDWHTAKKYILRYATVNQAYQNECESILDVAELELIKAVRNGDLSAIKFYLSTKGKGRGYVERVEQTGADGEPQKIIVQYVNSPYSEP
jgi:hypothetical protein